ncbi:MAG: D-alanyl-D-alanine carboxypeptidase [Clostridia bacterium]|nr:D-alanyl-D-alanine carboxypeptidase [Clostridia bacterium]
MKRLLCFLAAAVMLAAAARLPAHADYHEYIDKEIELHADCVYLAGADNGEVLYEKNAGKQTHPASLTKLVTAIVVLDHCENLNEMVTVPESCLTELSNTGSSLGGLKAGETLSIYDLLCCLLLQSANEAATTLADYVTNGDRPQFIRMMNETAQALGCTDSNFVNPHGLDDDDQYVTAKDTATLLLHAMGYPAFSEITSMPFYKLPATNLQKERTIINTNHMLKKNYADYYLPYINGGKTGTTSIAGHCVAVTASKGGYNYVCVVLNAIMEDLDNDHVDENGAFIDAKALLEWAFDNLELKQICDPDQIVAQVPIEFGAGRDMLGLSPAEAIYSLVPKGVGSGSLLIDPLADTLPSSVKAPIKKGDPVASARVLYAQEEIHRIDLVASADVKLSVFALIGSSARKLLSSWIFRFFAIAVIIALIILFRRARKRAAARKNAAGYRVLNYDDFMKLK